MHRSRLEIINGRTRDPLLHSTSEDNCEFVTRSFSHSLASTSRSGRHMKETDRTALDRAHLHVNAIKMNHHSPVKPCRFANFIGKI